MEKIEDKEGVGIFRRSDGRIYTVRHNRDRFFYPDEWMRFYDILKKNQKFLFNFLINTGARIEEARHVKVEDIDLERRTIILRKTKVKAKKKETKPRPRTIPISSGFVKYLRRWTIKHNLQDADYVIKTSKSTSAANVALKKGLERAGVKDWIMFSVHNIRKTMEVWLMALGIDGLRITAHLGHDIRTAVRHYVSPDIFSFDDKKKMRMIVGDLYSN